MTIEELLNIGDDHQVLNWLEDNKENYSLKKIEGKLSKDYIQRKINQSAMGIKKSCVKTNNYLNCQVNDGVKLNEEQRGGIVMSALIAVLRGYILKKLKEELNNDN